jgi:phenylalanyl-tRNA synthetase beta chain
VICGAVNFSVGDRVPLALPGSTLPGGLEIGARKAYGRLSEGMICSAAELGIGDDHTGILVLPPDAPLAADFVGYAGLRDVVLDVGVTPDKGYALSVRGIARELAIAYRAEFTDPADAGLAGDIGRVSGEVYPAEIADPSACDRFALREVRGMAPGRPTPLLIRVRLARAGVRGVSMPVDVTNYLMLESGQPLHAFDRDRLDGPIVVRRARPGERLETLDHVVRTLDPEDIVIADSSGPVSLAGIMGGAATEVSAESRDLVLEAAHFAARGVARASRRQKLGTDASARFERGVDPELPLRVSARAAAMIAGLGGGAAVPGCSYAQAEIAPTQITLAADFPDRVAGYDYGASTVTDRLRAVGCTVTVADGATAAPGSQLRVVPPSWRPDLTDPSDLAEEVIRLEGYERVPVRSPRATAGRGLTAPQRLRRVIGLALASAGYVEVPSQVFCSPADFDRLQLPAGDARRRAVTLANPVNEDEPLLRTTLLPGLLRVTARNVGRGLADLALFELGTVFQADPDGTRIAPILPVDRVPTPEQLAQLDAPLPSQPRHLAAVLAGQRELPGWWGGGRPAGWQDAIEAAREVLRASRVPFALRADQYEPWHPGRCAAVVILPGQAGEQVAGHAGELDPRVPQAFGLPGRVSAVELDMSAIESAAAALPPAQAPPLSSYPPATQDVALVVGQVVPAADVADALAAGARAAADVLLEDLRLFDVYTGEQVGDGRKSLAFTLRLRALDRTLTAEETSAVRDAAVAEAFRRTGAVLRGPG